MVKRILLIYVGLLITALSFAQKTDSLVIKKYLIEEGYSGEFTSVIFQFYYLNPLGKEIKTVALNIDDIRLITTPQTGNGLIQVYLSDKKTYKIFVKFGLLEPSKIYELNIDTKFRYSIDIYLSSPQKPIADKF